MTSYDSGPPPDVLKIFANVPSYSALKQCFWFDWGPIFYRGRLDRSARVLCVAQDPGPTERIACRTLVGDAGQRVQGFLAKIGILKSYVCLNAYAYAMLPSKSQDAEPLLTDPLQVSWRNGLFDRVTGPKLQAIIAFGKPAQKVVDLWPGKGSKPVLKVPHPSSHDAGALLSSWNAALTTLRGIVTKDPKAKTNLPGYGASFQESDYARIPAFDLPFGVPAWLGDDSWVRATGTTHPASVTRPEPDDRHTLIWKAPTS